MNQVELYKNIFGPQANEWETKTNIIKVSKQFPFFGLAQFYNLNNANISDTEYDSAAAKSSLFFKNNFYLNKLLLQENIDESNDETKQEEVIFANSNLAKIETGNGNAEENNSFDSAPNEIIKSEVGDTENVEANFNEAEKLKLKEIKFEHNQLENTETEILFEPLHTSDYFASQGIKLSNVVQANDKLGLQLKSFTSWLKTMKKAHPEKLITNNMVAEAEVQKQAEISNIEAEIFTEAMAEAYAVQGKNVKAIEVYRKLSLTFPEKSAFFADKIENLKK